MKKSQLLVVVVAIAAVAVIAAVGRGSGGDDKPNASRGDSPAPAGAVRVTLASSPEKLSLVKAVADAFNRTDAQVGGKPVFVDVRSVSSGDEEQAIARGADKPVVWSPASTLWSRLLDSQTDRGLVADRAPSIVQSPLVLAMWEPLARALGWPGRKIGFADILKLAQNPRGWAAYGHPEYGSFKFVHTNPSVSTAGLEVVAGAYYAATGKKEGLTAADIERPAVKRDITDLEQSIVHYGNNTLYIEDQLRLHGPTYASAVAMEETTLVDFNLHRGHQPKLVAIYPSEGTFVSDSPYLILKAPWVDSAEREGALAFQRFIASHVTPEFAARYGFRPADPTQAPVPPLDAAHGVDVKQPAQVLAMPQPDVVARIQRAWFENRKAANIELVVDTSASMNDNAKLAHAQEGLQQFLRELSPRDRVGMIAFSSRVNEVVPLVPFAQGKGTLREAVDGLFANGETALYDAVDAGVAAVARLRDPSRINSVVVLTDGQNNSGAQTMYGLEPHLAAHTGAEAAPIRVFTIAYGRDASTQILEKVAQVSDGKSFVGDTGNIEDVYRSISSFF